ncbi:hypothetical protein LGQ02_14260 [Bacillus shivajii]|uniref:BsuPI-related putative proteinase inhibitor n=1 Tax=Bacillus shivajii TaxID=1983719 RepID=UPI001CFACC7D|nr:BsuPI-related putative proteinase inhibitor [Bacillus shivajii]UCZ52009.1 hypothetical protein LGQ02_14260 [Bacillus shivajii]
MKRSRLLSLISVFITMIFISVACGTGESPSGSDPVIEDGEEDKEETEVDYEGLLYELDASVNDNVIEVNMTLENESDETKTIDFSSGQQFEVIIRDGNGEELYKYSEGMMFTQAFITESLESGETLSFQDHWQSEQLSELKSIEVYAKILTYAINGEDLNDIPFEKTIKVQK